MRRSFSTLRGRLKDARVAARTALGTLLALNVAAALVAFRPWGGSADDLRRERADLQQQVTQKKKALAATRALAGKVESARKAGDDYPARVYVAFAYQPERESVWERTKFEFYRAFYGEYPPGSVINYVWESRLPLETSYPNPYTARARMVVLRSGAEHAGRWVMERRDVLADYRRLFGIEPPRLVGVALMTDTDDTGERAEAWYDAITLRSRE